MEIDKENINLELVLSNLDFSRLSRSANTEHSGLPNALSISQIHI